MSIFIKDFSSRLGVTRNDRTRRSLVVVLLSSYICTMPFEELEKLFNHPLTDIGIQKFLDDWEKIPEKDKKELWES